MSTLILFSVGQVKDISGATERLVVPWDSTENRFEWTIFQGFSSLSLLHEIQKDLETKNIKPEDFNDRIIFMSMFDNIVWKKNDELYAE